MPLKPPAHKNTSAYQTPTQERTGPIHTIADYVASVEASEERLLKKKLTFDEWLAKRFKVAFEDFDGNVSYTDLSACWRAAQENM